MVKIKTAFISGFKGIGSTGVIVHFPSPDPDLPGSSDFVSIIGRNNAGKTSLLEALNLALPGLGNQRKPTSDEFHGSGENGEIRVALALEGVPENLHATIDEWLGEKRNLGVRLTWKPGETMEISVFETEDFPHGPALELAAAGKKALWKALPLPVHVPAVLDPKDVVGMSNQQMQLRQLVEALLEPRMNEIPEFEQLEAAVEPLLAHFENPPADSPVAELGARITAKFGQTIDGTAHLRLAPANTIGQMRQSIVLKVNDGTHETLVGHQGHGAQRSLVAAVLQVVAETRGGEDRELMLMMDEPEIYLHPQLCRRVHDALVQLGRTGSVQVLCTTHSPVFLDLADRHEGIVQFRKDEGQLECIQHGETLFDGEAAEDQRARMRMLLNFDPGVNEVFFAARVALVEGDTEIATLPQIAKKMISTGGDEEKILKAVRETTVINCRGKWTICAFQGVLNHFSIPYVVIHDQDADEMEEGANGRILELLGGDETRRRIHTATFEDLFEGLELRGKRDKPYRATAWIRETDPLPDGVLDFARFAYDL